MTVYFEVYKGILLEIYFNEDGSCYACCDYPWGNSSINSDNFKTIQEALEDIKRKIEQRWKTLKEY